MENEIVLPESVFSVIETSGVELPKATRIAANYAPFFQKVTDCANKVAALQKGNPDHVADAKRIRLDLGKIAAEAGRQKAKDKESLLLEGRFIDGLYKSVENAARLTQGEAQQIETYFEEIERKRTESLRANRIAECEPYAQYVPMSVDLGLLSDSDYATLLNGAQLQHQVQLEANRKAEAERIEREAKQAAERAESERKARLHSERKEALLPYWFFVSATIKSANLADYDEETYGYILVTTKQLHQESILEKQRIADENAKLKAKADAEAEKARKEKAAKDKEIADIKAKAAKDAADAAAENKRLKDEAQAAKEAAEAKAQAELAAKLEAERAAKLAPDKEKIKQLILIISAIELPIVTSEEAKALLVNVNILLNKTTAYIAGKVESL